MKMNVVTKSDAEQDIANITFDIFRKGVKYLSSLKKDGITLEGNSNQTTYVIEEINELITELLKLQKTITKFERGKVIGIDTIVEETCDVWLTSAILISMTGGEINDILDSANEKVRRTIKQEVEKGEIT